MKLSLLLVLAMAPTWGQGVITTVAGADWIFHGDGKPALDAPLGHVRGIAIDPADGRPVFADPDNCIVAKINADGVLSVIAGNGFCVSSGDGGPPTSAGLGGPTTLAFDRLGNLYIGCVRDIRKIGRDGTIVTAGMTHGNRSEGIAVDGGGSVYWTENSDNRIFKITPDGQTSVFAGTNEPGGLFDIGDDGPATLASFLFPRGLAFDALGNLYVADRNHHRIRKIVGGIVTTVFSGFDEDFLFPNSIAFDHTGALYVNVGHPLLDIPGNILKAPPALDSLVAMSEDGGLPFGQIAVDNSGNVLVADFSASRVAKVSASGTATTVAGNGNYRYSGEGLPAVDAALVEPSSLALEGRQLYINSAARVSRVDSNGLLWTAYNNYNGWFQFPGCLAIDPTGNLYLPDLEGIKKVDPAGDLTEIGIEAGFLEPILAVDCLAFDRFTDTFFVSAQGQVWAVDSSGHGKWLGFSFESDSLFGLIMDSHGNLFFSAHSFGEVFQVPPGGIGHFNTIAELPSPSGPYGLDVDSSGNVFIASDLDGLVRRVTPSGVTSIVAGGGPPENTGDGKLATRSFLDRPTDVKVDSEGNLYIAEPFTNRVRKVLAKPPSMQVSSSGVSFSVRSGGAPVTQTVAVTGEIAGLEFAVSQSASSIAWLSIDSTQPTTPRLLALTVDPAALAPGYYSTVLTITPVGAIPSSLTVAVALEVEPAEAPLLVIDKPQVSFTAPQGAIADSESLVIANQGGGVIHYTATASTSSGGNWLSISSAAGQALPGKPSNLSISTSTSGLNPGTYTGAITIQTAVGDAVIPVILTISSNPQAVKLTQTGMSFTAVENGGVIPPQFFGVQNLGTGVMSWTASSSTTKGGNWIRVSPASGSSAAGATVPQVTVTVVPEGLAAGKYYGTVRIDAPSTANRAAVVTIFLEVLTEQATVAAVIDPPELVFHRTSTGGDPGVQTLRIYNITGTPRSFTSQRSSASYQLNFLPGRGTLDPQQPTKVLLQPQFAGWPGKIYSDTLTFQFSDGTVQSVKLTMINTDESSPAASSQYPNARGAAAACSPTELKVSLNSFASSFKAPAGWPVALNVNVADDCGQPLVGSSGSSVVVHVDGEDDVVMDPLGEGTWQGTWKPLKVNPNTTVHIDAKRGAVTGRTTLTGSLGTLNEQPVFTYESVLSVFAAAKGVRPLAPGAFLSIYSANGAQLADSTEIADGSKPLELKLGNTQVYFNDTRAPISFASPGQLNVKVPWDVFRSTRNYIRIKNGDAWSTPIYVDIADAQPTPFVINGNLWAKDFPANGDAAFVVSESAPARAGDLVQIYAVGLGVTTQTLGNQDLSPAEPLAVVPDYSVNVGGAKAELAFAGLTPGLTGLYQVHFRVPVTTAPGNVPVTITVGGQTSPAVNLPVR